MDDNNLSISITAVDEASDVFESVSEEADQLATGLSSSAEEMNTSLGEVGTSAATMADELTTSMESASSTTNTAVESMDESLSTFNDVMAVDSDEISDSVLKTGVSFDTAASQILAATSSMEDSESGLVAASSYLAENATEDFEEMQVSAAVAAGEIESSLTGVAESTQTNGLMMGGGLLAIGIAAKQIGQPLQDFYTGAVSTAQNAQTALNNTKSSAEGLAQEMSDLKDPTSAASQEVKTLTDKQGLLRAEIESLEVPNQAVGKTTAELAAETAQHAAQVKVDTDSLALLTDQMTVFSNIAKGSGMTVDQITSAVDAQSRSNVNLGFTYTDSTNSLNTLLLATGNFQEAQQANQAAMDLSIAKHISLSDATKALALAFSGSGKGLRDLGIQTKDGASGPEALKAVFSATGTEVKNQTGSMGQSLAILQATWDLLMKDIGGTQGSILAPLVKALVDIITNIDNWAKAHPALSQAILATVGILGTLLVVLSAISIPIVLILGALTLMGISITLVGLAFVAGIAVIVAVVISLAVLIVAHWGAIVDWLEDWGGKILKVIEDTWTNVTNWLSDAMKNIGAGIEVAWNGVEDFFKDVWKGIENIFIDSINSIISLIDDFINGINKMLAVLKSVPGLGAAMPSISIPVIPMIQKVDDAIIAPGGNILTTNPNDYLIATQNPGSLLAGAGGGPNGANSGIIVNINGAVWSTKDQATMLANEIAKNINRQRRLTAFH